MPCTLKYEVRLEAGKVIKGIGACKFTIKNEFTSTQFVFERENTFFLLLLHGYARVRGVLIVIYITTDVVGSYAKGKQCSSPLLLLNPV